MIITNNWKHRCFSKIDRSICYISVIAMLFAMIVCCCTNGKISNEYSEEVSSRLIPKPESMLLGSGKLNLSKGVALEIAPNNDSTLAKRWSDYLRELPLNIVPNGKKIRLNLQKKENSTELEGKSVSEAYRLETNKHGITISAYSEAGLFYGWQTLLQLMEKNHREEICVPFVTITDAPRFPYRGLMIDCSRHFFTIEFLKKQIDMMAYYKLNRFHWHLTDDPGWRLEIKKYPELTQTAAWHKEKEMNNWMSKPRSYVSKDTPGAYGGYYTQEEAKELVAYAAEKNITVIPEIEMPGHSDEVMAIYPHLSCNGKSQRSNVFCIGNEETFAFLEDVLNEVTEIFPSEYIHIGSDEVDKNYWRNCAKCQKLMKEQGFNNEDELQSYLIKRISAFLHTKGKKIIGWDEILDGGLPDNAAVMSWRRGETGSINATKAGHYVIMSPSNYCYIDHYQWIPETQPKAIGDFLPIEKMYSYDPVPKELNKNERKYIIGAQANLWTEYIGTEKYAEYMIYPRLLALAEMVWSQQEQRSWSDFKVRVNRAVPKLQQLGYNTYPLSREPLIETITDYNKEAIVVNLSTEFYPAEIRYTTDGTDPTERSPLYVEPIPIKGNISFATQLYDGEKRLGEVVRKTICYHKAINKPVSYSTPFSPSYPAGGEKALVDGYNGMSHGDGRWQGFNVPRIAFVIDLGKATPIENIQINFEQNISSEIFFPKEVAISLSADGKKYNALKTIHNQDKPVGEFDIKHFLWKDISAEPRFIKVEATANDGWIFIDEVEVW